MRNDIKMINRLLQKQQQLACTFNLRTAVYCSASNVTRRTSKCSKYRWILGKTALVTSGSRLVLLKGTLERVKNTFCHSLKEIVTWFSRVVLRVKHWTTMEKMVVLDRGKLKCDFVVLKRLLRTCIDYLLLGCIAIDTKQKVISTALNNQPTYSKIPILRPPLGLFKSGLKDHFWTVPKVVSNQMYTGCRNWRKV